MQQGAALVPVLCLGEIACLHNACNWPAIQQWTYKNLGFPIPYLVVGRWGFTPFPRRTGLKFVVGQPIKAAAAPSDGQVGFVIGLYSRSLEMGASECAGHTIAEASEPRPFKWLACMPSIDGNHVSTLDISPFISPRLQIEEEEVEKLHAQYYGAVEELYHKYSRDFPGCKGVRLVMH
jgi:hypothetical protein